MNVFYGPSKRLIASLFLMSLFTLFSGTTGASACNSTSPSYLIGGTWYSDKSMKVGQNCSMIFESEYNTGRQSYKISDARGSNGLKITVDNRENGSAVIGYTASAPGVYDLTILIQAYGLDLKGVNTMWQGYKITVVK